MSERDLYGAPSEDPGSAPGPPSPLPPRPHPDDGGELPSWLRPADETRESPIGEPVPPRSRPEPEPLGGGTVALGVLAALLAAFAGAVAWGLVAHWTGDQLSVLACGVGVLVGGAVWLVTGKRGYELQVVAVLATLAGVIAGKYLAFAVVTQDELGVDYGVLSSDMVDLFRSSLGDVFSAFDALWALLAVGSAWVILVPGSAPVDEEYHTRNPVDHLTRGLPRGLRITVDWIVTIVGAVAIVLLVKAYVVNPYRIPSSSMEPTLHCARPGNECEARFSDRVLANRFVYHFRDPKRGEIIVFDTPPKACGVGGTFVKRVIGLPGEKLEVRLLRGDGYVFINGKKLDEPYIREDRRQVSGAFGPVTVPKDHYFMMGDNRESSCDSRDWGALPRGNVIGKVFATYWPPQRVSLH